MKAVAILLSVLLLAACGSGGGSAPSGSSAQTPSLTTHSSAAPGRPSLAQRIHVWFKRQSGLGTLAHDDQAIAQASSDEDINEVTEACSRFKQDVIAAEAATPAPDAIVRRDTAHALDADSTAATECLDGDYAATAANLREGTRWTNKATQRILKIMGD